MGILLCATVVTRGVRDACQMPPHNSEDDARLLVPPAEIGRSSEAVVAVFGHVLCSTSASRRARVGPTGWRR